MAHPAPEGNLNAGSAEALLGDLEAVVFAGKGGSGQDHWQRLLCVSASRKLLGRLLSVAGATLFTCVPVSAKARAAAKLRDASAIRGSGDRRGSTAPIIQASPLTESRQHAANSAVIAAAPWASEESRKVAKRCVETWLGTSGIAPSANPTQKDQEEGLVAGALHELLPQALSAIRSRLSSLKPSSDASDASASMPTACSIAIVRSLHWLMQQCDYLVLKDRATDIVEVVIKLVLFP